MAGGLIVSHPSWRWIFYVNVPICLTGLALAWRGLPPFQRPEARPRPDIRGIVLLSPGVALILYGLAQVSRDGGVRRREVLIPLAAACLGARREQRDADHAAGRRVVRDRCARGDPGRALLR